MLGCLKEIAMENGGWKSKKREKKKAGLKCLLGVEVERARSERSARS
jgi:hypothetical protein